MIHNCVEEFGPFSGADCNAIGNHQIHSYQDPVPDAASLEQTLITLENYLPTIRSYQTTRGMS